MCVWVFKTGQWERPRESGSLRIILKGKICHTPTYLLNFSSEEKKRGMLIWESEPLRNWWAVIERWKRYVFLLVCRSCCNCSFEKRSHFENYIAYSLFVFKSIRHNLVDLARKKDQHKFGGMAAVVLIILNRSIAVITPVSSKVIITMHCCYWAVCKVTFFIFSEWPLIDACLSGYIWIHICHVNMQRHKTVQSSTLAYHSIVFVFSFSLSPSYWRTLTLIFACLVVQSISPAHTQKWLWIRLNRHLPSKQRKKKNNFDLYMRNRRFNMTYAYKLTGVGGGKEKIFTCYTHTHTHAHTHTHSLSLPLSFLTAP